MDPFLNELNELSSRLRVGMQFDAYLEQVGDAQVAADNVDPIAMSSACHKDVYFRANHALESF